MQQIYSYPFYLKNLFRFIYTCIIGCAIVFLFNTSFVSAQSFQNVYAVADAGANHSCATLPDGGFILTGSLETNSNNRAYLVRLDSSGHVTWFKFYKDLIEFYSFGKCVVPDRNGGYTFTGTTFSDTASNDNVFLYHTDSTGFLLWSTRIGSDLVEDDVFTLDQTADGGFLLAGSSTVPGNSDLDMCIWKTDSAGTLQWTSQLGTPDDEWITQILIGPDHRYYFTGTKSTTGGTASSGIAGVVDSNGVIIHSWEFSIGNSQQTSINDAVFTVDSMLLITGNTTPAASGIATGFILELDTSFQVIRSAMIDHASFTIQCNSVSIDDAGKIVLSGNSGSGNRAFFLKADSAWAPVIMHELGPEYPSPGMVNLVQVIPLHDGYFANGTIQKYPNPQSLYCMRSDTSGFSTSCLDSISPVLINTVSNSSSSISFNEINPGLVQYASGIIPSNYVSSMKDLCTFLPVEELSRDNYSIRVFPNPALKETKIRIDGIQAGIHGTIRLLNALGVEIYRAKLEYPETTLPRANWPDGIYVLQVISESGWSRNSLLEFGSR